MKEEIWNELIRIEIGVLKNFKECARSPCNGNHFSSLYSDVTATLNQLPVQEIPGPVETKPLWEFDQTLSRIPSVAIG